MSFSSFSSSSSSTESISSVLSRGSALGAGSTYTSTSKEASRSGVQEDHVDQASQLVAEVAEGDLPRRLGYEWASPAVTRHFSKYRWPSMVKSYATAYHIFAEGVQPLTTFTMGVKGITQISSSCMPACLHILMFEFLLTSLQWASCVR